MNRLDDYIKAYEEAEKIAAELDDRDPLPLHDGPPHLHEPVKMTKKQMGYLQKRLYNIIYSGGGTAKYTSRVVDVRAGIDPLY